MQSQFNGTIYDYEEICPRCEEVVDKLGMVSDDTTLINVCRKCAEEIELEISELLEA